MPIFLDGIEILSTRICNRYIYCRTFVELNLGSTHGTLSESDVAPVSLQSRTYSVRFGTSVKSTVSEPGLRRSLNAH